MRNGAVDVRSAGKELGARYVMEGSLRQAGSRLRIAVQLVDAVSGAHLWAETYDRAFQAEGIFELQDEVVPRIVSTVADTQGVLPHSMGESLRTKDPSQLSPYEAVLRSFVYLQRVGAEEHATARDGLERAVEQAPGYAPAWAMLAIIFREEYNHGFNVRPDPLGTRAGGRAAVPPRLRPRITWPITPWRRSCSSCGSCRDSIARHSVRSALNPMDGFTFAYLGMLTAYAGEWERGCALVGARAEPQSPSSRLVLVPAFVRCLSEGRLPRCDGIMPKVEHAGLLAHTIRARSDQWATRRAGARAKSGEGAAGRATRLRHSARGVREVVGAGTGREVTRWSAEGRAVSGREKY